MLCVCCRMYDRVLYDCFFFSSRRRHTRCSRDWSSDVCSSDLFSDEREVFVAEDNGDIVGTYCLQANHQGGGAHVANCGYMTAVSWTGRGVARAMCTHSLDRARERGFRAMQFNFVISTNDRAVRLWQSFGFEIVGRLPGAFQHPTQGYVDAYVLYCNLW